MTEPRFFAEFDVQIAERSLDELRTYLRWHYVRTALPFLSSAFVNESFDFNSKTLHGVPQLKPRWKRCVALRRLASSARRSARSSCAARSRPRPRSGPCG